MMATESVTLDSFLNRFLTSDEEQFIEFVHKDLEDYLQCYTEKSVLLFPPLSSFHRLLIHKAAEQYPLLYTFSVGQGVSRRTTVCVRDDLNRDFLERGELMSVNRPPSARGRGRGRWSSPASQSSDRPPSPQCRPGQNRPSSPQGRPGQNRPSSPPGRPEQNQPSSHQDRPGQNRPSFPPDRPGPDLSRHGEDVSLVSPRDGPTIPRPKGRGQSVRAKNRRPDVQVYVPRGRRQQQEAVNNHDNDKSGGDWDDGHNISGDGMKSMGHGHGTKTSDQGHGTKTADQGHGTKSSDQGHGTKTADQGHGTKTSDQGHGTKTSDQGHGTKTADQGHGTKTSDQGHVTKTADQGHGTKTSDQGHGTKTSDQGHGTKHLDQGHETKSLGQRAVVDQESGRDGSPRMGAASHDSLENYQPVPSVHSPGEHVSSVLDQHASRHDPARAVPQGRKSRTPNQVYVPPARRHRHNSDSNEGNGHLSTSVNSGQEKRGIADDMEHAQSDSSDTEMRAEYEQSRDSKHGSKVKRSKLSERSECVHEQYQDSRDQLSRSHITEPEPSAEYSPADRADVNRVDDIETVSALCTRQCEGATCGDNIDGATCGDNMDGATCGDNMDGATCGDNMDGATCGDNMDGATFGDNTDGAGAAFDDISVTTHGDISSTTFGDKIDGGTSGATCGAVDGHQWSSSNNTNSNSILAGWHHDSRTMDTCAGGDVEGDRTESHSNDTCHGEGGDGDIMGSQIIMDTGRGGGVEGDGQGSSQASVHSECPSPHHSQNTDCLPSCVHSSPDCNFDNSPKLIADKAEKSHQNWDLLDVEMTECVSSEADSCTEVFAGSEILNKENITGMDYSKDTCLAVVSESGNSPLDQGSPMESMSVIETDNSDFSENNSENMQLSHVSDGPKRKSPSVDEGHEVKDLSEVKDDCGHGSHNANDLESCDDIDLESHDDDDLESRSDDLGNRDGNGLESRNDNDIESRDDDIESRDDDIESHDDDLGSRGDDLGCPDGNADGGSEEVDEDSWDKMFDDDGECLDPEVMEELTSAIGKVKIKKPVIDYLSYTPREPEFGKEEMGHVIEIYDFSQEFKTEDLMSAFQQFKSKGFDIQWVDDTHALGVFNSAIAATSALCLNHPLLKVRPMSDATRQSKVKAKKSVEFLLPYKARPETSATTARRLVMGSLGLAPRVSREQRDMERQKLRQAKEKKKLMKKQKDDIWEGTYTPGDTNPS